MHRLLKQHKIYIKIEQKVSAKISLPRYTMNWVSVPMPLPRSSRVFSMQLKFITKTTLCAITAAFLAITPVHAQNAEPASPVDIMPTKSMKTSAPKYNETLDTHPPLKISPDKSELVRLDKDAGSIIIGSPSHLSVLADSARTLVLVPQIPGATYVTILDKQGNVLMQRHVIVASPKKKYVRIRKSCNGDADNCQPTQVYYCPDMCHKVNVAQEAVASQTSGEDIENSGGSAPQAVEDNSGTEGN